MEKKMQSMTDTAQNTVAAVEEDVEEVSERAVNKVVTKALFLNAKESKSGKLGITVMLIDGINAKTGQVDVVLEQKSIKGQKYTVSPVISTWIEHPTDEEKKFLDFGGLKEIACVISGSGEFRRIHKFLTRQKYEEYLDFISILG